MGLLDRVEPIYKEEKKPTMDEIYGYETDEEKKNNLLMQFLEYVKASKERDRAKLMQSKMI